MLRLACWLAVGPWVFRGQDEPIYKSFSAPATSSHTSATWLVRSSRRRVDLPRCTAVPPKPRCKTEVGRGRGSKSRCRSSAQKGWLRADCLPGASPGGPP
eukprot:1080285-Pyramimonas_sp.AAC.1